MGPNTQRIVERIANKMLEKERLEAEINSLVERQSIYMESRPSTGHDMQAGRFPQNSNHTATTSQTEFITTAPRPVKQSDGFYQCVAPPRRSMETDSSVYTYDTSEEDDDGTKTVPTTTAAWTPPGESAGEAGERQGTPVVGTGRLGVEVEGDANRPLSVGVAF
ncbi:hypothetical protein N0V88_005056 [Collariella sp. IMI 366227]|nr:hypothetical protein N0V88_005056 [Collariella sp. IMI 366227]